MSKIKTKKVLTPEQKKKRIRNIIIVAVILVAASVATYWMQPQNKALAESEVFSEEEVKAQAEKIIGLLNAEDFDSLQSLVVPDMQEIMNKERMDEGRHGSRKTGEILFPLKQCRMRRSYREVRISQPFT